MSLAESIEDGHCSTTSPPTKKRKLVGLECGLENTQQQVEVSHSNGRNGNGTMASNGNGVASNGAENGAPKQIDEGLYSRQLFVLGKLNLNSTGRDLPDGLHLHVTRHTFIVQL